MAAPPELTRRFRACLAYRQGSSWRKPLINPIRFLRNQLRKYQMLPSRPGQPRTVAGFHVPQFTIITGEAVSEEIASYGIYEANLTEAFLRLAAPAQVVVDIGMHLGYYSTLLAVLVGRKGQVHAFEPTPSTRALAQHNVEPFAQIIVHPQALWSSEARLTFQDYGPRWMGFNSFKAARMPVSLESRPFEVQAIALDNFRATLSQPVSILKIDAESAEKEILIGAEKLLHSDHPIVSLEVGDFVDPGSSRSLIDFLAQRNYAAWELANGRFCRHQPRQNYSYDNLIFAPTGEDLSKL